MANRFIKDSICRSNEINELSWFEEVLFYRLLVNCDDYGRFDGRSAIIKGTLFPLKTTALKDIEKAVNRLEEVGLIEMYESGGVGIIQVLTWHKHQTTRAKKSKYPEKSETSASVKFAVDKKDKPKEVIPPKPAVITMTLNSGAEYEIYTEDVQAWASLYPAVDVMQALRNMKGWLMANPSKRKTQKGIKRFINTWLQKEQDRGGSRSVQNVAKSYGGISDKLLSETRGELI